MKSASDRGVWTAAWTPVGDVDGVSERNALIANREWVYVAADKNAQSVKAVRFKVMKFSRKDDDQEVFDGPLVEFLEKPGPGLTGKDFLYLTTIYKELAGNAFWELLRKRDVAPIIPTSVVPVIEDGKLTGYKVPGPNGAQRTISVDDMLHDRHIDPARPYWGVGKLTKIGRWVDTSFFLTDFLRLFFVNGTVFGGFIETEEESEDRIKLIRLGLANDHQGVRNAHKIGILPRGNKFTPGTVDLTKMQTGETDDRYRDKILAAFGVPKSILGIVTDVNRANAEAMEYVYAKNTVKPIVDDLIEFMNARIAPLLDPTGKTYFAYDNFIPRNLEIEIKRNEVALAKHAYMTVNEVRALDGLPPVPGGDKVPEPIAPMDQGEGGDDKTSPKKALGKRALPHIRRSLAKEDLADGIASAVRSFGVSTREIGSDREDSDAVAHKAFVSRVTAYQDQIAEKVRNFNNKQHLSVTQSLAHITKDVTKGDLFDMEHEVTVLVDAVTPILKGLIVEQALEEFAAQEFQGALDIHRTSIRKIVERAANRLGRSYNDTTAELLRKELNEGIQGNEDLTQLAERVKTVYDYSDAYRAPMVAHTEAFYIANEGSKEAYRQSGVVKTIRWYTAEDEHVCEFCGPEDGRIVGINESFYAKGDVVEGRDGGKLPLDYRTIGVPPLHPQCRCFIRPEEISIE